MVRKKDFFIVYRVFLAIFLSTQIIFSLVCFANGNQSKDEVWGETFRPSRENFKPESAQKLFKIETSILKNPLLQVDTPGRPPKLWEGSLRLWKTVYKSPDYFNKMVVIEQDADVPFQGKPSVKISIAPSEEEVYLELYQEISMKERNLKDKKIRLSFYAYRKKPPTSKEFFITGIMFNKENTVIGTTVDINPHILPGKWLFFVQEGTVKPETELFKVSLRFISGGDDTIWLSGFLLEEI